MRKYFLVISLILLLLMLMSCNIEFPNSNTERKKPIPFTTKVEKDPLVVEYVDYVEEEAEVFLLFQAYHTNEISIETNDYEFLWPTFLFDENEVPYQITKFQTFDSYEYEGEIPRRENSVYIKLTIHPAPVNDVEAFMLPLYITPSLFENGYPVYIENKEVEKMDIGDMTLNSVTIDENTLSFTIYDEHPEKSERNISYTFKRIVDDHPIYPVFQSIDPHDDGLNVKLAFSEKLTFPLQLNIQRTSVHLPEWRFSFVVPIDNNKN